MGIRKKAAIGLTSAMAVMLLLSACGSNGGNNGNTAANNNTSSSGNAGSNNGKPVELNWYTIGTPQKDVDKVMEAVSAYTKDKIGATVKMTMIDWGDYNQKMQVLTASGADMDIMFTAAWAFDYVQNARKGAFAPIDDLLAQYGKGITDTLNPAFLSGSKVDGKNYGVPANKELPTSEVWRFNKNILDENKLSITDVRSLESLEPLLQTVKQNNPDVTPLQVDKTFTPYIPYDYLIEKFPLAVKLDDSSYKIVNVFETPEMKQALETMHKYYQAGYIPTEAATLESSSDVQATGKWFADKATTQPFADNVWSTSYGYPIVSTPMSDELIYNASVMGSMQAISANSKHKEKAMEFLNLLNTDPVLRNMVDSGIEGTHYKVTDGDYMENLPESKNYDMPTFALGNIMITHLNPGDPADKWEQFKKYNDAGKPAALLGFNFDPTKVSSEIAAVQNAKESFWAPLMTGTVDPDKYLPQAIKKLNDAGLGKILTEAQTQLDAWKATQGK
ncbi:putative aldouronate transport system substrate-binding protein [Paenibacillus catalpae]|uniref:Putative aldouronate transport system substrate-binding protein n=1 Tax=Paenibacillus catalpae TaxID=1045775 RepID=A0A1I2I2A2_9BACL|nr:ABC transporter substrate-binding protein [Paenibacillus catalpae]SFF36505.1 putative aldouronate transport system substrate-binding protein [Paenibacillus catalpae]